MPLYEDIARSVLRQNEPELQKMSPEGRKAYVGNVVKMLSQKSEDELISFLSAREGRVSPEITQRQQYLESRGVTQEPARGSYLMGEAAPELVSEQQNLAKKAQLQSIGVQTDQPLPAGDVEMGFGVDQVESLTNVLTQHFGTPVTVFRRGEDILYLDPTDDVVKRAEPNMLGSLGGGMVAAGDIAGTVGGGAVGAAVAKTPAGVVAGEAVGSTLMTGLAEYSRLLIGRAMGVHDLSHTDMAKQAGIVGGKAGAVTAATGGIIATAKGVKNFIKGGIFTKEQALKHGLTTKEADAVIDEVNRLIKGQGEIRGTLYKRGGDAVAGSAEAQIRKNIKHAGDFLERDLADQQALTKALDVVTKPSEVSGGKAIQEVAESQLRKRVSAAGKIVSRNVKELDRQLSNISSISKEAVGEKTRDVLIKKSKAVKTAADAQWTKVQEIGGYNKAKEIYNIPVPAGENIKNVRSILERRSSTATTKITKGGTSKIFAKDSAKKPADLADFNRDISDLRTEIRSAYKSRQFGDPQTRDMEKALDAMVADRKLALIKSGKGDVLKQIEKAEDATADFYKTYRRSVVKDLTEKTDSGVFKIKSKEFVDKMLKADPEEAKQLLDVIGDNPSLINKWKEGIADAYKREAIEGIKPLQGRKLSTEQRKELTGKIGKWVNERRENLELFFSKEELDQFAKTGGLAVKVKKQTEQYQRILKNVASKYGRGKLTSLDPDNLVKFVTNNTGSFSTPTGRGVQTAASKIRTVKGITKNYPGAWKAFQDEYSSTLRKELVHPETGFIKPQAISDMVNKNPDIVKEMMGEQYLKDLSSINKVSQILAREPVSLSGDEFRAGVIQAIRSGAAPPLTRRGRAFTAAVIFDTKRAHDVMAKGLLNPETMHKIAELSKHNRITRETVELAASLGMISEDVFQEE